MNIDTKDLISAGQIVPCGDLVYIVAYVPPQWEDCRGCVALCVGDEVKMVESPLPHLPNYFLRLSDVTLHPIRHDSGEYVMVVRTSHVR